MISLSAPLSGLNAFATGVNGTAYNIANISTGGFQPVAVRYQSGPGDQGVRPVVSRSTADTAEFSVSGSGSDAAAATVSLSGVEPGREMTSLITNQRAFEANAAVIRTGDDLLGTIIDLKV